MAACTLSSLSTRVWKNLRLSMKTKVTLYNACVISTLLYWSECWTTYAAQEYRLNVFHMRSLRKLLGISWMSRTPNTIVLSKCGLSTMFTMLRQRILRWLGHVWRMKDGRIPKDILYGESLLLENAILGVPTYATKICASGTWRNWVLTSINGKNWPLTAPIGEVICNPP